jgi:single-stranded-DNA-specific exonuclease
VSGFNLYDAIDYCSDLLEGFGGHMYAAGLTMKIENISLFRERFEKYVTENLSSDQMIPRIEIDAKINFDAITSKFYRILKQFEPFGPQNMSPVFITENVRDAGYSKLVGNKKEHLRLDVVDNFNNRLAGIAFNQAGSFNLIKRKSFNICYSVEENEFKGKVSLQLIVKDIKSADDV